jgi:serine/threonine-protein kinase
MSGTAEASIGVIGRYNLLERLEGGGPGELFRARDTHVGRTAAVRLLPRELTAAAASRDPLLAQARSLQGISHPNVIALFEAGEHDGRVFIAFEFVKGQSLRAELSGRPMNVRLAIDLATQLANAVADVHAAGLPCVGVSPDSIVITAKGLTKLPVFELATREGFEADGGQVRLRDYGSPEEAQGGAPDERSDTYSVGAVLFEMLTARRPSLKGAAAPSGTNPNVPRELDEVVLKAIAPNPDRRYQSAAALAADLRRVSGAEAGSARRVERSDAQAAGGSGPGRALLLAALLLAVAGALWLFSGAS